MTAFRAMNILDTDNAEETHSEHLLCTTTDVNEPNMILGDDLG